MCSYATAMTRHYKIILKNSIAQVKKGLVIEVKHLHFSAYLAHNNI